MERAYGVATDSGAVDLAFRPNVVPPRLIRKNKNRYPKIARQKGIEANVYTEILIDARGELKSVNIIGIRLSKSLPGRLQSDVEALFIRDTKKMLIGSKWTPTVINGRKVPIKQTFDLKFELE